MWRIADGDLILHVKLPTSGQLRAVTFLTPTTVAAAGILSSTSYLQQNPSPICIWDVGTLDVGSTEIPIADRPDKLTSVSAFLPLPVPAGSFATVHACGRIRLWDIGRREAFAALRWCIIRERNSTTATLGPRAHLHVNSFRLYIKAQSSSSYQKE